MGMSGSAKLRLCPLGAIDDPGSRGLEIETSQGPLEIFVVRRGDSVYGYLNRCPHTGVNLEWLPHQFLDPSGGFIQCATHGALFRIEDGYCLRGPCAGDSLQPLELAVEQGTVFLLMR